MNLGWNVNVKLAKLAAEGGHLVRKEAESFLEDETLQNLSAKWLIKVWMTRCVCSYNMLL
jgi:hypothetical protein